MNKSTDICVKCSKPATLMCHRCHETYCTQGCQIRDWKVHKNVCIQMPDLIPIKNIFQLENLNRTLSVSDVRSNTSVAVAAKSLSKNPLLANTSDHCPKLDSKDFELKPKQSSVPLNSKQTLPIWKSIHPLPEGCFFDVVIQLVDELCPGLLWVTELKHEKSLRKLLCELNSSITAITTPAGDSDIYVGALVAAPLNGVFYRAEVLDKSIEKEQAIVRLIDYGNELQLSYKKLFRITVPSILNINAFAFRIHVSEEYGPFELESLITIRLADIKQKQEKDYYNAEIQLKTVPFGLPVELLSLSPKVEIKHIFPDGQKALLQLHLDGPKEKIDLNAFLNTGEGLKFDLSAIPKDFSFIAARVGQMWQRACFLGYWKEGQKFLVYLIDDGAMSFAKQIKKIPDNYVSAPMRIIAILSQSILKPELLMGKNLTISVLPSKASADMEAKHMPCVLKVNDDGKIIDVMAAYFRGELSDLGINYWTEPLTDGCRVFITHILSHAEIYISSFASCNYPKMFASFYPYCEPYTAAEKFSVGELVLAKSQDQTCFRGKIISGPADKNLVKLFNIDTGAVTDVPQNQLRKPSLFVRSCPVFLMKVKLKYLENIPVADADNKAIASLQLCQCDAIDFDVKFDSSISNTVDLIFRTKEQESLCKKLLPLLFEKQDKPKNTVSTTTTAKPKSSAILANDALPLSPPNTPVQTEAPQNALMKSIEDKISNHLQIPNVEKSKDIAATENSKKYTVYDLEVVPITVGDSVPIYVLDTSCLAKGYITAAEFASKEIMLKMDQNLSNVSKYCKCPHIEKGYTPSIDEVFLAVFSEDGEWYRALCMDQLKDNQYLVAFLDYGNIGKVNQQNCLPITKDLFFPSHANICYIDGLSPEQCKTFERIISNSPMITCKVTKNKDDTTYNLRINDTKKFFA